MLLLNRVLSGYKCLSIQKEGVRLDVLGEGWQRSVLRFQSKDRLCSVDFEALPLFTWIEGPESQVPDAIGAAAGNCSRPSTHWPSLLKWLWMVSEKGSGRFQCVSWQWEEDTHLGMKLLWPQPGVGVSNGIERMGQHHQQNKQRCGWRRAQSLQSAWRFWAWVSGRMKSLLFFFLVTI